MNLENGDPASLSLTDAAAIPLGGLSAWAALVSSAPVGPGIKVLVHAGAGGVGSMAIQLADHRGAYVATTCSTANIEFVKSLGADQAIAYDRDDFARTVSGFDIVFDTLGGEAHRKSYLVLRKGGTMVSLVAAPFENQAEAYGVTVKIAQVLPDLDRARGHCRSDLDQYGDCVCLRVGRHYIPNSGRSAVVSGAPRSGRSTACGEGAG